MHSAVTDYRYSHALSPTSASVLSEDSVCIDESEPKKEEKENEEEEGGDVSRCDLSIDEVVLVGGCSLLPCVRATIKTALLQVGVTAFGGDINNANSSGKRDFCTSVNPHECVAHGLAVKGALMMGVREGKLKDLLMIDSVPYAVGIMTFLPSSSSYTSPKENSQEDVEGGQWVFDPILERGMRLPCTGRKTFPLDSSSLCAKKVSLDIYEETFEGNSVDADIKFISNCDLPIGHLRVCNISSLDSCSDNRCTVDVIFHMSENGEIKFVVEDSVGNELEGKGETSTETTPFVLGLYFVCLLILYIVVKIFIVGNSELLQELEAKGGYVSSGFEEDSDSGEGLKGVVDELASVASAVGGAMSSANAIDGEFEF